VAQIPAELTVSHELEIDSEKSMLASDSEW
jgi:hypothetical protein